MKPRRAYLALHEEPRGPEVVSRFPAGARSLRHNQVADLEGYPTALRDRWRAPPLKLPGAVASRAAASLSRPLER
jgi:hypothetical protein